MRRVLLLCSLVLYTLSGQAWAAVSPADQDRVIDQIARILEAKYIHADVAREMVAIMEKNREDYHALSEPRLLVRRLNDDLFDVSRDHHVKVLYTGPGKDPLSALRSSPTRSRPSSWGFPCCSPMARTRSPSVTAHSCWPTRKTASCSASARIGSSRPMPMVTRCRSPETPPREHLDPQERNIMM